MDLHGLLWLKTVSYSCEALFIIPHNRVVSLLAATNQQGFLVAHVAG